MTDYEAIMTLIAKHAQYADDGDAERRAALYSDDGQFTGPDGATTSGRDAILTTFSSRPPIAGKHVTSNAVIDIDGDAAAAATDFVFFLAGDAGFTVMAAGRYDDRFVRTSDGWRFAARRINTA